MCARNAETRLPQGFDWPVGPSYLLAGAFGAARDALYTRSGIPPHDSCAYTMVVGNERMQGLACVHHKLHSGTSAACRRLLPPVLG